MVALTVPGSLRPPIFPDGIPQSFALEDFKWGGFPYGTPGGTVTWGFAGTSLSNPALEEPGFYDAPGAVDLIEEAFLEWALAGDISFAQAAEGEAIDILFDATTLDGVGGTLAEANVSFNTLTGEINTASITFDTADDFDFGDGSGASFFLVALHEIGHTIGLAHVDDLPTVMNSTSESFSSFDGLTEHDIAGAEFIYGPSNLVVEDQPDDSGDDQGGAEDVVTEPISEAFESVLFDEEFYLMTNPDVAAAGLDAKAHYDDNGFREGRDPAPLFDNDFYLVNNPDVAAADLNPLVHFEQFGIADGRDPNALFDTDYYLSTNGDVAAAGLNPLAHYAGSGWLEGRNPSLAFDGDAYLQANPDIADIAINPLEHYLLFGSEEGREIFAVDVAGA